MFPVYIVNITAQCQNRYINSIKEYFSEWDRLDIDCFRKISCIGRICDKFLISRLAKIMASKGGAAFIRVFVIKIQQNVCKSRMAKNTSALKITVQCICYYPYFSTWQTQCIYNNHLGLTFPALNSLQSWQDTYEACILGIWIIIIEHQILGAALIL